MILRVKLWNGYTFDKAVLEKEYKKKIPKKHWKVLKVEVVD